MGGGVRDMEEEERSGELTRPLGLIERYILNVHGNMLLPYGATRAGIPLYGSMQDAMQCTE